MTYGHHTPHHPDPIPYWRVAYLALQLELGVRSKRGAKFGPLGCGRPVGDGSDLTDCKETLPVRSRSSRHNGKRTVSRF